MPSSTGSLLFVYINSCKKITLYNRLLREMSSENSLVYLHSIQRLEPYAYEDCVVVAIKVFPALIVCYDRRWK